MPIRNCNARTNGFFTFIILAALVITGVQGCKKASDTRELYHKFPDKTWQRFNLLSFEVPVVKIDRPYDIYLFACFTPEFQYQNLDVSMIMTTSAGEERIHEYSMNVKSPAGAFLGEMKGDSCQRAMLLQKELKLNKPGMLKIQVENLIPRMVTEGIRGVGIRMVPSGK